MERLGESCFVSDKGGRSELVREGNWQPLDTGTTST